MIGPAPPLAAARAGCEKCGLVGDASQVDSFSFRLSKAAEEYPGDQINRRGKIRIVVSPADSSVAAT